MKNTKRHKCSRILWALTKKNSQEFPQQSLLNQLPLMEWRPSILRKLKQKRRRQQTLQSLQKYKQRALPCSDLNCLQSNLKSKPKLNWLFSSLISPRSTGLDTNWAMVLMVFFLMTQRRLLCTLISSILITLKGGRLIVRMSERSILLLSILEHFKRR